MSMHMFFLEELETISLGTIKILLGKSQVKYRVIFGHLPMLETLLHISIHMLIFSIYIRMHIEQ